MRPPICDSACCSLRGFSLPLKYCVISASLNLRPNQVEYHDQNGTMTSNAATIKIGHSARRREGGDGTAIRGEELESITVLIITAREWSEPACSARRIKLI